MGLERMASVGGTPHGAEAESDHEEAAEIN